jgi:DNA-directed RNA polymerase subunit D
MVPIPTDLSLFNYQKDCVCGGEGYPSCSIMYLLKKSGPCTVYSGDMEPLGSPDLKVKDENIPIVELADRQSVLIYAHAVMGTASTHVKWQVANGVGYKYLPKVSIENDVSDEDTIKAVIKGCPKKVFEDVGGKLTVARPLDCIFCDACKANSRDAVTVEADDRNFVFKFETDGSLTAQEVLDKAAEILSENAKAFATELRGQA